MCGYSALSNEKRTLIGGILLGAIAISLLVYFLGQPRYGSVGTIDFIEYWSAFRLLRDGLNPYDEVSMQALQLTLGQKSGVTIMMWNPPWTLLLLSPVLSFSFLFSVQVWLALNFLFIFLIALITRATFSEKKVSLLWASTSAVLFVPLFDCLAFGQLAIFLTFWFSVFLWAQKNHKDIIAGIALVFLSIKPHLFLIFFLLVAMWIAKQKRTKILKSALGSFLMLSALLSLTRSFVFHEWIETFQRTAHIEGVVAMNDWISSNLVGWARGFFADADGPALWPRYAMPLLGIVILLLIVKRYTLNSPLEKLALPVSAVSVLFSPYGWYYDQSLLVVLQIVILMYAVHSSSRTRVIVIGTFITLQTSLALLMADKRSSQDTFYWMPAVLLVLWFMQQRVGEPILQCKHTSQE